MKPEIKQKWIAALRSGEYEQGKAFLKYDNKFCCLGVLCDLHAKETGAEWDMWCGSYLYYDADTMIPQQVADWAGIPYTYINIDRNGNGNIVWIHSKNKVTPTYLAELNDNGISFAGLTTVIEEKL